MNTSQTSRIDWVDYAKGFCIIMVVMMHSTLGVEQAAGQGGWMHVAVAFARPFRMPDFFLISGLFLARVVDRDWREYLDKKVIHFAYFYVLWVTIQFAFKAPMFAAGIGWRGAGLAYLEAFIEPFGTLWFFALAARVQRLPKEALIGLSVWVVVNGALVLSGYADRPFVSLPLGFVGAGAVVVVAALMARSDVFQPLRYCGQKSIVVYLAFFLPMAATRIALLKTGIIADLGTISLLVTAAGVAGALAWYRAVRRSTSCSSDRPGRSLGPSGLRRCSRRNDSQRPRRALIHGG